jgi:hypothetical protein
MLFARQRPVANAAENVGHFAGIITEINRIHLVLFGMENKTFGPYLATVNMIRISVTNAKGPRRLRYILT